MDVCYVHGDREAVKKCEECGKNLYKKCTKTHRIKEYEGLNTKYRYEYYCKECWEKKFDITKGTKICGWLIIGGVVISIILYFIFEYALP